MKGQIFSLPEVRIGYLTLGDRGVEFGKSAPPEVSTGTSQPLSWGEMDLSRGDRVVVSMQARQNESSFWHGEFWQQAPRS